jgi:hypothetical protein
MEPAIPNLILISGDNADTGKEIMLNLDQVRMIDIRDTEIRFVFSEQHTVNVHGRAVPDLLTFLGKHCMLPDGSRLTPVMSQSSAKPPQDQSPKA